MNPANKIIKLFGNAVELARVLDLHESAVYRWGYPKDRGGLGGVVPRRHYTKILKEARKRKLDLSLESLVGV